MPRVQSKNEIMKQYSAQIKQKGKMGQVGFKALNSSRDMKVVQNEGPEEP